MDFKALRNQILGNIDHYNDEETKIVVTKLLDFLVDISEKRSQLEKENKEIFAEMKSIQDRPQEEVSDEQKTRFNSVITKANEDANRIVKEAKDNATKITLSASEEAQSILDKANAQYDEILQNSVQKIKAIIEDIKKKDDEAKLYRKHILSIFRKTIFRFSDTNYYIIRSDNKEFRELLHFFEVDEKLQKLCDDNINKLLHDPKYQELVELVSKNPIEEELVDVSNILKDDKVTINNKTIDIHDLKEEEIDEVIVEEEYVEDEEEEEVNESPITKSKFLDVINQYKNNKND